jgi:single-strand DNA-binding protein
MVKIEIIGRLGKDATVNQHNGKYVINFSVAHSEKYKDSNGTEINKTVWVECSYWSEYTRIAQYLTKGTQVYVEGQPEAKTWTSNTGQTNASLSCKVRRIELLGSAQQQGTTTPDTTTNNQTQPETQPVAATETVDDLPF